MGRTYEYVRLPRFFQISDGPNPPTPRIEILTSFPDPPCGSFDLTPRTPTRVPVWTLTWSMLLWSGTKNHTERRRNDE